MHSYLRSVGFSGVYGMADMNGLIGEILEHPDEKKVFEFPDGRSMGEISRSFAAGCGLTVCGEYDTDGAFYAEYIFPFAIAGRVSSREEVMLEKHVAQDSFCGACDDLRVGTTIIFYLRNMGDYLLLPDLRTAEGSPREISFSALASDGTILLPMAGGSPSSAPASHDRRDLLRGVGDDEDASDPSRPDPDAYSSIMERVGREDLLTIVDTYFMPDGAECECYSILGTIVSFGHSRNILTGEQVCRLEVVCNDISLDICVNAEDLTGEPAIGRRFKGNIWLMGEVAFG